MKQKKNSYNPRNYIDLDAVFEVFEDSNIDREDFTAYRSAQQSVMDLLKASKMVINAHKFPARLTFLDEILTTEEDRERLNVTGIHIVYNRAVNIILGIDLQNTQFLEMLEKAGGMKVASNTVEMLIKYFESIEFYEKCAELVPYRNFFYSKS